MPLRDCLLRIRVEVLLLLLHEGLSLEGLSLLLLELKHGLGVLFGQLFLLELSQLLLSLSSLLLLLLLCQLQLFISLFPELSEFLLFQFGCFNLLFLSQNLQLSALLDCGLHVSLLLLLEGKVSVGFVFSLSNLLIEHLLLVVLQSSELLNLLVNHLLALLQLSLESCSLSLLLHSVEALFLGSMDSHLFLLLEVLQAFSFLHFH